MAPPAEKNKKHSSAFADQRPIFSAAIGGKQQQTLGSVMTMNHRILKKIWICNDLWMDIFPHFDRPQLGLKMALLSPRLDALVDKHFNGKNELPILTKMTIHKTETQPKLSVEESNPMPKYLLPNKIRFNYLRIDYIDHSVVTFLRSNRQIFDKGTNLYLDVDDMHDNNGIVQPIWNDFAREIWPIFAPNIRHLTLPNEHLDNLRLHASPSFLSNLDIISINSIDLLPDSIADDGPNATAGQALSKWLHIPRSDGKPKQLSCREYGHMSKTKILITSFKEAFLHGTTSAACYIIRIDLNNHFEPTENGPFELMNKRTNEVLTLEKEDDNYENANVNFVLKRCQIGRTIQWEDKKTDNVNNVKFTLNEFGPLSPPKSGK